MCPCSPDGGKFVYVLLVAAAVVVGIRLMRHHWSRMGPGLRTGGIIGIALLIGLLGHLVWPARSDTPDGPGDCVIETGGMSEENSGLATDADGKAIAYYFHRTMRCYACQTIETLSKQVIEQEFAGEIASGLLEYRAINIDTPENSHFETDFELTIQALVLVRMENGQVMEWKKLERIWELFEDIGAFAAYVQEEVHDHLYPDARAADVPANAD